MNLNYNILRKDTKGYFNIEMVGRYSKQPLRWNTKIKVLESEWDRNRQMHKTDDDVNKRLIELSSYANKYLLSDSITSKGFKDFMDLTTGRTVEPKAKTLSFFDTLDDIVANSSMKTNNNGETVSDSRVRLYKSFANQLRAFEIYSACKLSFDTLDRVQLDNLREWLTNIQQLSNNTLAARFKLLRTICNDAKKMDVDVCDDVFHYTVKSNKVENVVLTEREVQLMLNYKCDSERLQNVQDLFTFGVYTGLRFSDLKQLTQDKIHNGMIELHQQKTGGKLVIPLHNSVKKILVERGIPRPISGYRYNAYLRELAKLAGVTELVELKRIKAGKRIILTKEKCELISSHTCRRTFATYLYKNGMNPKLIMNLTGHKQLSTFLNYVVVSNDDAIEAVTSIWNKQ